MSVWDDRNLEIAAQRRAKSTPTPTVEVPASLGGNGFGWLCGVFLIGIGVLGLLAIGTVPNTGNDDTLTKGGGAILAIVFIVGGFFSFGGGKITDETERARHQAASQGDTEGANEASASGCGSLVLYIVIFAILGDLLVLGAMGGMGL